MLTYIIEITCLLLVLVVGAATFKKLNAFYRVLFLQIVVWGVIYLLGHIITIQQQQEDIPVNNQWLMNIHMFIETGLLLYAARLRMKELKVGILIYLCGACFLLVYVFQIFLNGIQTYLHYADLMECVVVTLVFTPILFASYTGRSSLAVRIACIGLLIYFACSIPYVSMMNYLQVHSPKLNSMLYHLISDVLANIRYLLMALAFVLHYRTVTTKE